jgi:isoleucyl-tRNA synthetase
MGTLPWLEKERQSKVIGKSLEAKIILSGYTSNSLLVEQQNKDALKELLNVSQLDFYIVDNPSPVRAYIYTVTKADGQKCERCWHWETDIGPEFHSDHPTICGRCVEAVKQFKA